MPVIWIFDVFLVINLNKLLNKQSFQRFVTPFECNGIGHYVQSVGVGVVVVGVVVGGCYMY